jgi:glycosyltransferase involved in cell wall biosynthesis
MGGIGPTKLPERLLCALADTTPTAPDSGRLDRRVARLRSETRIAMIGTRGVPPKYGGFETAVDEVGRRLAARGYEVVVYCRNDDSLLSHYDGMRRVSLPALRVKQAETLSHSALSIVHAVIHGCDAAIVFNAANAPLIPLLRLRRIPVAVHLDGLEWNRSKWKGAGSHYYRWAARVAVRCADRLIADARAIQDVYRNAYDVATTFIPYGAEIPVTRTHDRLGDVGLEPNGYHLIVARMEPENNLLLSVDAYVRSRARLPLVIVGSAPYSERYSALVRESAKGATDVRFLGSVWDQELLNQLYGNTRLYIHGHSVGGTNPSLLRAMGAGAPIAALDVVFNREVLSATGMFFADVDELISIIREAERNPADAAALGQAAQRRVAAEYDWDVVADQYEQLCRELIARTPEREPRVGATAAK